jgi:hypothetical protein
LLGGLQSQCHTASSIYLGLETKSDYLGSTENKKLGDKNKFGFYVKFHESMIKTIFKFAWQLDIGQVSFWIKRHFLSGLVLVPNGRQK